MRFKSDVHVLYSGLGGHTAVVLAIAEAAKRSNHCLPKLIFTGIEEMPDTVREKCDQIGLDYVHIHKKKGIDIINIVAIIRQLRIYSPSTILIHGSAFLLPVLLYKLGRPCCSIFQRDTQSAILKTHKEWVLLFWGYLICARTIFLTEEARASFLKKYPFVNKAKSAIIPNPIDEAFIHTSRILINDGIIRLGMQSRLQQIKDHPTLIRAFAKLLPKYNNNLRLIIAGDGVTKNALEKLVRDLAIADYVNFTGMLGQDALINFLNSLDIYVHATDGETMSNAILQAMACGLPIVASDVWGVNNVLVHSETGYLYEHKNVNALEKSIHFLLSNKVIQKTIGSNARAYALKCYHPDIIFEAYLNL